MAVLLNLPEAQRLPAWAVQNPFIAHLLNERASAKKQAAVTTLNDFMPKDYGVILRLQDTDAAQRLPVNLSHYIAYYQKVAEFISDSGAAHGMLGFAYYHQGDVEKAVRSYQNAVRISPQFFWFHYNLGVLLLKKKDYARAAEAFAKGLEAPFKDSLIFFRSSKVYLDLLRGQQVTDRLLAERLQAGYKQAQQLLIACKYYSQNPEAAQLIKVAPQLY